VLLGTALAGAASVLWMPRLPAANPGAPVSIKLFGVYIRTLAEMDAAMLTVTLAWSGFYMIAMMALMIVPEYEQILAVDYAKTSLLVGMLGIAVAVGSVVKGIVSGRHIRPKLIPLGAVGMAACFLTLGLSVPSFKLVAVLISLVGFFAGFYILPLQALLQYLSPPKDRGRFLGTAGALSFLFASGGAGCFWLLTGWLEISPHHVHIVCGVLALSGCVVGTLQMRRILRNLAEQESAEPNPGGQS
jgi:MFS family permease